jgi:hypothetical protein
MAASGSVAGEGASFEESISYHFEGFVNVKQVGFGRAAEDAPKG